MRPSAAKSKLWIAFAVLLVTTSLSLFAGCSPEPTQKTGEDAGEQQEPTANFEFSVTSNCATCHTDESSSLESPDSVASFHADQECMDCHTDTEGLIAAHEGVAIGDNTAKRLKSTEVSESTCTTQACHGSYEELAAKTQDSIVMTDRNGIVVNPHDLPDVEEHDSVACGNCHDMHGEDSVAESAPKACLGCHHMNVYECGTCHD